LVAHNDIISKLIFTRRPDKILLISSSFDMTIKIWDPMDCFKLRLTCTKHTKIVSDICFLSYEYDRKNMASASYDKTIKIWNCDTGGCTRTLKGHKEPVTAIC